MLITPLTDEQCQVSDMCRRSASPSPSKHGRLTVDSPFHPCSCLQICQPPETPNGDKWAPRQTILLDLIHMFCIFFFLGITGIISVLLKEDLTTNPWGKTDINIERWKNHKKDRQSSILFKENGINQRLKKRKFSSLLTKLVFHPNTILSSNLCLYFMANFPPTKKNQRRQNTINTEINE